MADQKKSIVQSKTLWGAAGMFVLFLYVLFTGEQPPMVTEGTLPDVAPATDAEGNFDVSKIVPALIGFLLWLFTNWGRVTATKPVTLTGK